MNISLNQIKEYDNQIIKNDEMGIEIKKKEQGICLIENAAILYLIYSYDDNMFEVCSNIQKKRILLEEHVLELETTIQLQSKSKEVPKEREK